VPRDTQKEAGRGARSRVGSWENRGKKNAFKSFSETRVFARKVLMCLPAERGSNGEKFAVLGGGRLMNLNALSRKKGRQSDTGSRLG